MLIQKGRSLPAARPCPLSVCTGHLSANCEAAILSSCWSVLFEPSTVHLSASLIVCLSVCLLLGQVCSVANCDVMWFLIVSKLGRDLFSFCAYSFSLLICSTKRVRNKGQTVLHITQWQTLIQLDGEKHKFLALDIMEILRIVMICIIVPRKTPRAQTSIEVFSGKLVLGSFPKMQKTIVLCEAN